MVKILEEKTQNIKLECDLFEKKSLYLNFYSLKLFKNAA
jgi:hypothetical protein